MPFPRNDMPTENLKACANRRAVIRYRREPASAGRLFINESYKSLRAQVVDLSENGIGLMIDEAIDSGTIVSIEINEGIQSATMELHGQVTYCISTEGAWRCGCELLTKL